MAKFLLALVALAMCHISAHGVEPVAAPNATQEFLDTHNQARAEVGVGPLEWSEKLANATSLLVRYQRDKKGCNFAELSAGKYGGNQLWASGATVTPRMAVEEWVAEKKYYNYGNNSCAPDHRCGVYTQVVWRKSLELGCAQATCGKEHASLTICFYNPPGNVIGESPY
uniref:Putative STS14 protein-like n=1 Tax=Davidia involucrata TaxID=16924 RepID=A0A5B7BX51_DAVIN